MKPTHDDPGMAGQIERQGQWLFHRRSWVGLIMLPLLVLAIWKPGFPAPLLSSAAPHVLAHAGFVISLAGLALRWITAGTVPADTSRRSTRQQSAQTLNTLGMYSIVRHPLYLANAMVVSGFVLATGSLWLLVIFQLVHALYLERVLVCEDRFLAHTHGQAWQAWAARTPTLIPRPALWKSNTLTYSIRTVLRREYNGVFGLTLAYFVLQASRAVFVQHLTWHDWMTRQPFWSAALLAGVLTLLILRTLKRHTRLLHVGGR